jgi:glucose-1-phosphate cytidylyltransferase
MNVVILAGGRGTRLSEETSIRPKPMVEIGGKPIIWHIMKIYSYYGHKDFLVACGYKGEMIKEYFHNYFIHNSDFVIDVRNGSRDVIKTNDADWRVGLIDTGLETMTGGRIRRLRKWLGEKPFMVTYGDGVADINIDKLTSFHRHHGKIATVSAVRPPARFGGLSLKGARVVEFSEKPQTGEGWINGGFFVFNPDIFRYFKDDQTILERNPLELLAQKGELMAYRHTAFWHPMDTLRDRQLLEEYWSGGGAPWKVWT